MNKEKGTNSLFLATFILLLAEVFSIISWKTDDGGLSLGGAAAVVVFYGSMLLIYSKTSSEKVRKILEFIFAGWEFLSAYLLGAMWESFVLSTIVSAVILLGTIQMLRKLEALKNFQAKVNPTKKEATDEVGEPEQVKV